MEELQVILGVGRDPDLSNVTEQSYLDSARSTTNYVQGVQPSVVVCHSVIQDIHVTMGDARR
jgi:hypothetical protein